MKNEMRFVFLVIMVVFWMSGCGKDAGEEPVPDTPGVELFSDNFNRANSSSTGNGWTEMEPNSSAAIISSNQLVLSGGWDGDEPIAASVVRPLTYSGSFKITINFRMDAESSFTPTLLTGTNSYFFFISTLSGDTYFFINSMPPNVSMVLDSLTYFTTYNSAHSYTAVITKIGSALTISITNKSTGITLTGSCSDSTYSSFTHFALTGGGNVAGSAKSTYVDDVIIENI